MIVFQTLDTEIAFDGGFLIVIILHGPKRTGLQTLFTTDTKIFIDENMRGDCLLFGESQSRIIVSLDEKNLDRLREIAERNNAPLSVIGSVGGDRLVINDLIDHSVGELKQAWREAIETMF